MKILVSTTETQGRRKNDFCFVPDGELVMFATECDREPVDGRCGCKRAMSGVESSKATTTMKVVDAPVDLATIEERILENFRAGGWLKLMGLDAAQEEAKQQAAELVRLASCFDAGTVLEKRGAKIQAR